MQLLLCSFLAVISGFVIPSANAANFCNDFTLRFGDKMSASGDRTKIQRLEADHDWANTDKIVLENLVVDFNRFGFRYPEWNNRQLIEFDARFTTKGQTPSAFGKRNVTANAETRLSIYLVASTGPKLNGKTLYYAYLQQLEPNCVIFDGLSLGPTHLKVKAKFQETIKSFFQGLADEVVQECNNNQ